MDNDDVAWCGILANGGFASLEYRATLCWSTVRNPSFDDNISWSERESTERKLRNEIRRCVYYVVWPDEVQDARRSMIVVEVVTELESE